MRSPGLRFRWIVLVFSVGDVTKELEVELEQLRLLVVAMVRCASGCGGGTVDDKVGEDDEREMLGRAHLSLGGG